jgi:cytochrome b subunit of formate dehydrogenase
MIRRLSFWCLAALFVVLGPGVGGVFAQESETCLECHGDTGWLEDDETRRLHVDLGGFENSVHGFLLCVDCHADLAGADPWGHDPELAPVDCSVCHADVQDEYAQSLHAYARQRGNLRAPTCAGCHGKHDILSPSDRSSRAHRRNLTDMCASCHGTGGLLTDQLVRLPLSVQSYAQSVHAHAFRRGIDTAAVCTDCHGVHLLRGRLDPESKIHAVNVSATCGQCHGEAQYEYDRSIHGRALQAGIFDSPTCNDCHGEHHIVTAADPSVSAFGARLAVETCRSCHEDQRLIAKYGLADYVVETYVDSYHGWARRWDSPDAATCVACHATHLVLPARDEGSTIHPDNVAETCRQCHPRADQRFALSYTHRTAQPSANPVTRWIEWAYLILIPTLVGAMVLHNALIFVYYLRRRRRLEREEGTIPRMDRSQVVQHLLLAVSFIVLVITGFALRFPDAFWVQPLVYLGMTEALRSLVHRIAAVVLLGVGVWHVLYLGLNRRGRRDLVAMLPRWRDVSDASGNIQYYLGLRKRKVRFDQYDYTQKAEYWALVWGTVVMALSGFVLWFPAQAVRIFPTWIVQASELLHYYEAWLAMLAILVWHFFFVLLHPLVYPMSWTWLTGEMGRGEAEYHHGDWVRSLEADRKKTKSAET